MSFRREGWPDTRCGFKPLHSPTLTHLLPISHFAEGIPTGPPSDFELLPLLCVRCDILWHQPDVAVLGLYEVKRNHQTIQPNLAPLLLLREAELFFFSLFERTFLCETTVFFRAVFAATNLGGSAIGAVVEIDSHGASFPF